MSITLNDNIKIAAGKPVEPKSYNSSNLPYATIGDALLAVPIGERYIKLPIFIGTDEYWFKDGVADGDLILRVGGGAFTESSLAQAEAAFDNTTESSPVLLLTNETISARRLFNFAQKVKTYIATQITGLWDDRGEYDASGGNYPSSGGSGTSGAILKGDIWTITVGGTLPTGQPVEIGDTVRALIDTPGNTQTNWSILQNNIGYVPENITNKNSNNGYAGLDSSGNFVQNSDKLPEGVTNKFWTNALTIAATLTGFTGAAGTVTSADSILSAFQKVVGNISNISTYIDTQDKKFSFKLSFNNGRVIEDYWIDGGTISTSTLSAGISLLEYSTNNEATYSSIFPVTIPAGTRVFWRCTFSGGSFTGSANLKGSYTNNI